MNIVKQQAALLLSRFRRLNFHHYLPDFLIIIFSLYASVYLRVGWTDLHDYFAILRKYCFLFVVIRMGTFLAMGVYDIIWRYISLNDAARLVKAVLLSSVLILATTYIIDIGRLPRAVFFIDLLLVTASLCGIRFLRRLVFQEPLQKRAELTGRHTLIFGAGTNGRIWASRFQADGDLGLKLLGFVDDNPQKVGRLVSGVKVLGTGKDLPELLRDFQVRELIVTISHPPGELLRELFQVCRPFKIRPRLITSSNSTEKLRLMREVELSDLLSRPRRDMDVASLRELIQGRRVLVTGAGGSIGSELARQILAFGPSLLLLLDHSEYNLYQIDQELQGAQGEGSLIVPLLVDIKDRYVLESVFKEYLPEIVFHAAAYKHVHLVESNPFSSILNNILGTQNLLGLSEGNGVSTFVLISTDKAVNPAGVMGATKRVCELMTSQVGKRTGRRYCAVRFGNVLGSSGSLIPILKEQIEKDLPVTITHKDMTRYFMLISEAVSLVLKAATIAEPGNITLLRMGEPIRIVEIAKSLIALMGKTEEDIPIVFTGIRPGEKMFEELYISGNEIITEDPDILVVPNGDMAAAHATEWLDREIENLVSLAREGSKEALFYLNALVQSKGPQWEMEMPVARPESFTPIHRGGRELDN